MTEDTMTCDQARDLAFEYRRGELGEPMRALLEAHLDTCSVCATYVGNVAALLDAAGESSRPLDDQAIESLWRGIETALPRAEPAAPSPAPTETGRRRLWWLAAAAVVLALGWWVRSTGQDATPIATDVTSPDLSAPDRGQVAELSIVPSTAGLSDAGATLSTELLQVVREHGAVSMYADRDARWRFDDGEVLRFELESGTFLFEFLPDTRQSLAVDAHDWRIEVVGTVFVVSVVEGRISVGVAAGSVRMRRSDGLTVNLEAGAELGADGTVAPLRPAVRGLVERYVSLAAHQEHLDRLGARAETARSGSNERVRERRREREASPTPVSGTAEEDSPALEVDLLALAEGAQRTGHWREAAEILRFLIDSRPPGTPEAGLARLELARLLSRRLFRNDLAIEHLRTFLTDYPTDPAAESVRRELCRLQAQEGAVDPLCVERDDQGENR